MAADNRFSDNAGRVTHEAEIDQTISEWTRSLSSSEVFAALGNAEVPCGPIYSVEDMFADPHYRARGAFEKVQVKDRELEIPSIHPKLTGTPGRTDTAGPDVGQHTDDILKALLQLSDTQIDALRDSDAV